MTAPTTTGNSPTRDGPSSAPLPSSDQCSSEVHTSAVAAGPSASASLAALSKGIPPGQPLASDQPSPGSHKSVAGDPSSPAMHGSISGGVPPGSPSQPPSTPTPDNQPRIDGGWAELRLWAEILEDIQKTRKANDNRIGIDGRGRTYRLNVDPDQYRPFLAMLYAAEVEAWKNLIGSYRRVVPASIRTWQAGAKGIGEKRMARILGHLGDPCIATPHRWEGTGKNRTLLVGEPRLRTVAQLWAYCGIGDPGRKHKAGMSADELFSCGSTFLKSQLWNMAGEIVKVGGGGEYRPIYDEAKVKYAERIHNAECKPCYAKAGDPWKPGHQHTAAMRYLSKRVLKDLWLVRREDLPTDQRSIVDHTQPVGG